ncbi:HET-domain-containing protein [Polyplosphaeria fusca]|uniref:HET-domain-containing protein n=1 Tax=Polyplosphaeria fusca TaxID=682080 RepID=A0A9P4R3H2_9PLEO|nr:HET-domain-containing protein [Polyplosphaeria fusca]
MQMAVSFPIRIYQQRYANRTTRELGIMFLWVDALCIVQDDPDDKLREIAQMPQVYRCAAITIAVSAHSTVTEGFLQPHTGVSIGGAVIELPFEEHDARPGTRCDLDRSSPLDDKISWSTWRYQTAKQWYKLLELYTSRRISVPTDRIIAISAIAKEFGDRIGHDIYLAGHWKSMLPFDLAWRVETHGLPRPMEYQGPSWSWIGINGYVEWIFDSRGESSPKMEEKAELLAHHVVLENAFAPSEW